MKTIVEHLSHLIRIASVSSLCNRPMVDYAVSALYEFGWQTKTMEYTDAAGVPKFNLIAAPGGTRVEDPGTDLAFVCHTDTVPYAADWLRALDPFVADGQLYGCGACDVKGFLACLLTAAGMSEGSRLRSGLRLLLTADEEVGCVGASHLLASGLVTPRRAVIGEPTSLRCARAGKGYCLAEITAFGQQAHSAHPEQGASAIYGAARLITAIEELADQLSGERDSFFTPGFTTLNVGTIQGGTAKNVVAGQCSFLLEWRPLPGQPVDGVHQSILRTIEELRQAHPEVSYEINLLRQQEGFETDGDSPLVRSIEKLTGRAATSIPFGSEASLLSTVAEEVVVFGPGDMRTAHSNRECVPVAELQQATECLRTMMSLP